MPSQTSVWQFVGQLPLKPSQTYGEQDGLPELPAANKLHWPFVVAPKAWLHVSHAPLHAELQQ